MDGGEGGGRNGAPGGGGDQDEEDVWYHKEKLFKVRVLSVSLEGGTSTWTGERGRSGTTKKNYSR